MARKAKTVVVSNRDGLHLRPAHAFVKLASQFDADISVTKNGETIDGKSILSILTLAATRGAELEIVASGGDADAALEALAELVENGFLDEETEESKI